MRFLFGLYLVVATSLPAFAHNSCEARLSGSLFKPRNYSFKVDKQQAFSIAERIILKLQLAAIHARQGDFAKAFDLLDSGEFLKGSGLDLVPFKLRHVLEYTPSSHEDLQAKLVEEFAKFPSEQPMVHLSQGLIYSWVVLPEGDVGPEVWDILHRDRMLELTEELGHAAQALLEYSTGRWNISLHYEDSANVQTLIDGLGIDVTSGFPSRTPFIEADVYAFMLEEFGPDFVPATYMGTFYDSRVFVDRALRPGGGAVLDR